MNLVNNFIGIHLVTQFLLMFFAWQFRPMLEAIYHFYIWSPAFFYFYVFGTIALLWLLVSGFRFLVLRSGLGDPSQRARRTRGH